MVEYFKNIYLGIWTVLVGMKITLVHLLRPTVTLQYPEEKLYPEKRRIEGGLPILFEWKPPEGYRGDLFLDNENCIGCMFCAQNCPVDCFMIVTERAAPGEDLGKTPKGQPRKLKILKFDIDMTKCMFCGLCIEACPTEGLVMTANYEFSSYTRKDLVHHFANPEKYRKKDSPQAQVTPGSGPSGTPSGAGGVGGVGQPGTPQGGGSGASQTR